MGSVFLLFRRGGGDLVLVSQDFGYTRLLGEFWGFLDGFLFAKFCAESLGDLLFGLGLEQGTFFLGVEFTYD